MVSARVVFVVVLELLGGGGLTKVEGEGVEHVLLGVGKGRVLRDLGPDELCVSDGSGHLGGCCVVRCVGRKGSRKPLAQEDSHWSGWWCASLRF